jgi:dephospho-CoA kinase
MLKVGLTGGIACGKSRTLKQFEKLGACTIDADHLARYLMDPGKPGYQQVIQEFGKEFVGADSRIDRKKLGELVFTDEEARNRLNRIIHPLVFEEERRLIEEAEFTHRRAPMIIVDAALMVETGSYRNYQVVVMVHCRPEVQVMRLMMRDQLDEEQARNRINSQMPLLEKIKYADYIIENSGKLSNTDEQVKYTFKDLLFRYEENDFEEMWKLQG